jgi:DNA polymerase I
MAKKSAEKSVIPDGVEYWPECDICPKLCKNTMHVCMEGEGSDIAPLMIIGEAPGSNEDDLNLPFVGNAGRYLRDTLLVNAKIPESKIRFTNAVRCHPVKNKTPSITEIKRCRRYLEEEIKRIKPKVIAAMGNVPLASMLKSFYKGGSEEGTSKKSESKVSGILRWHSKKVWLNEFNCWMVPTLHPSFCIRNVHMGSYYSSDQVVADLKLAWKLANTPLPEIIYPETILVDTPAKVNNVLKEMESEEAFAFDIETGGHGRTIDRYVIGCSFCNSKTNIGYYLTWEAIEKNATVLKRFKDLLKSKNHYKIMHNGAYEVRVLGLAHNIYINNVKYFDTMAAAHLIDENFSKRLKDLVWIHTYFGGYDIPLEKYKVEHKIVEDYSKIPLHMLYVYGAMDAVTTYLLYLVFKKAMEREKVRPLFDKIVMPVRRVMSDAEMNGFRVDIDRAQYVHELCNKALKICEENIYEHAGEEFKITSPKQLQYILYNKIGFTPFKKTKTGYSTDAESMDYLATQPNSEIVHWLKNRSYVNTMNTTHIGQAIEFSWKEDGRAHTNYNITGAVTGRASASRPSLHNVPRDGLVRSIYVSSPGCVLVEADLKSAEMAAIAAVSGEYTFIQAFEKGLDIHAATYRKMKGLPPDAEITDEQRQSAKAVNFGLVYGLTEIGLAKRLGISVEQAYAFINSYFDTMTNVYDWMELQKKYVRTRGYVVSVFGRKRRIPLGLSDNKYEVARAERQAMNSPIQSCAADYTYIGLIRLRKSILKQKLKSKIIHTVHDCVITDTVDKEINIVKGLTIEAFTTPVRAVPIKMIVEVEAHKRWGEGSNSQLKQIFDKVGLKVVL